MVNFLLMLIQKSDGISNWSLVEKMVITGLLSWKPVRGTDCPNITKNVLKSA
jgi:hypothetical protein